MKRYNTEAIVLKNINYKESGKKYTLLTRKHGKIWAVAFGVRKISSRRGGNLDSLNLISVKISENNGFNNIDEVITLNSFKNLKTSYKDSMKAYYLAELVYKSVDEDSDAKNIFDLLRRTFETLDRNLYETDVVVAWFELMLLEILGYKPRLDDFKHPPEITFILKKLTRGDLSEVTPKEIKEVDPVIKNYIYTHLSDRFKSLEIF